MKASTPTALLTTLFTFLLTSIAFASVIPLSPATNVLRRSDEDWELVIYPDVEPSGQCGGTSSTVSGPGNGACHNFKTTGCVDVKLRTGIFDCSFQFKTNSCDEKPANRLHVQQGAVTEGYQVPDIKFVTVACNDEPPGVK
ncbi:hypothetical protein CBS147333_10043 [Penicillium roqueforti]|nr:hypothetical protein CBS147333_10043 [Penicillium roqueforti]KAI3188535.1 hypothetical protein CBS147311_10038 [Penicillium roqueforti]KAI3261123.1 hypothetical protein CBS147308_10023 [Penicillium roqueforti]KAI3277833.1 hypothetical protein DTO003C3_10059 [Penicillium roqueforti]